MVKGLEGKLCEEQLRAIGLLSPEETEGRLLGAAAPPEGRRRGRG